MKRARWPLTCTNGDETELGAFTSAVVVVTWLVSPGGVVISPFQATARLSKFFWTSKLTSKFVPTSRRSGRRGATIKVPDDGGSVQRWLHGRGGGVGPGRITRPGMGKAAEKGQCLLPLRLHYFSKIRYWHFMCRSEYLGFPQKSIKSIVILLTVPYCSMCPASFWTLTGGRHYADRVLIAHLIWRKALEGRGLWQILFFRCFLCIYSFKKATFLITWLMRCHLYRV